jgi:hypothetical protein
MLYPQDVENHLHVCSLVKALSIKELEYFFIYFKNNTDSHIYIPFNKKLLSNLNRIILIPELAADLILKREDVLFNTLQSQYNENLINDLGPNSSDSFKEIDSRSPGFTHAGIGLY